MIPIINKDTGEDVTTVETRLTAGFTVVHDGIRTGALLSLLISRAIEEGLLQEGDLRECNVIHEDEAIGSMTLTRQAEPGSSRAKPNKKR